MAFATVDDVRIYAPDVTDDEAEVDKVEYLLEQAEDLVSIEFPDLQERVGDGRTPLIRIQRVEAEMVASVMNNPRARQSESQTVGGLSASFTLDTKVATGLLRLTDEQRNLIRGIPASSTKPGGMYVLPLSG